MGLKKNLYTNLGFWEGSQCALCYINNDAGYVRQHLEILKKNLQFFFLKNINEDYVLNSLKQVIFSKVYLLKKKQV